MGKENVFNDGVKNAKEKQDLQKDKIKFPDGAKKPKSK